MSSPKGKHPWQNKYLHEHQIETSIWVLRKLKLIPEGSLAFRPFKEERQPWFFSCLRQALIRCDIKTSTWSIGHLPSSKKFRLRRPGWGWPLLTKNSCYRGRMNCLIWHKKHDIVTQRVHTKIHFTKLLFTGEEFMVLENIIGEKFIIPCKNIQPWSWVLPYDQSEFRIRVNYFYKKICHQSLQSD